MIIDYRCPECNNPVVGRKEVVANVKTPPKLTIVCKGCRLETVRRPGSPELGCSYYYSTVESLRQALAAK
jgi:hypothetical protein